MSDISIISPVPVTSDGFEVHVVPQLFSSQAMLQALQKVGTPYVALVTAVKGLSILSDSISFMVDCLEGQQASMVYADYVSIEAGEKSLVQLAEPEKFVVRDSFDFGPVIVTRTADAISILTDSVPSDASAFYSLTLGLQIRGELYHTGVPVGFLSDNDSRDSGDKQFDYVNPRNTNVQKEREAIFTAYLKAIGALVNPAENLPVKPHGDFPLRASVIIPVKNRVNTVANAIKSALEQRTSFDFNVIVVDNHSTDGTTDVIADLASQNDNVIHLIPQAQDLGIGGCWNLAVNDPRCGTYAVQLDSDDLYSSPETLQTIVSKFQEKDYALVVGSYKLVDFDLNTIPPGVIDHKEWTDNNGPNNILRINGMGAPRAFSTTWLRHHQFPNVSYGEDYAAVLQATRRYLVARIFTVLYLCRRWRGNSDAGLTRKAQAAHDAYKDRLRSDEIEQRIKQNAKSK